MMDMASRKQYLRTLLERYLKARKRQKGSILDEYCRNTGQNRKYVIRKISGLALSEPRPPRKRAPYYGPDPAEKSEYLWRLTERGYGYSSGWPKKGFSGVDYLLYPATSWPLGAKASRYFSNLTRRP